MTLREDVDQMKGSMDEIKGGMAQMMSLMKDLMDKQEKAAKEAQSQANDVPKDNNPLLGYVPGFGPPKDRHFQPDVFIPPSKGVATSPEEGENSQEGFIPPPSKERTSCTIHVPTNNSPKEDDYLDL